MLDHRNAAVLSFKIGTTQEPGDIAIAALGLAQQSQSRRRRALARLAHQEVDAHDRLDAALDRRTVEFHHAEEIALIGQRDRRHLGCEHGVHQLLDAHDTIDERVLGMHTQMHEPHRHGSSTIIDIACRTGSNERRCSGEGARSFRAARCAGVE